MKLVFVMLLCASLLIDCSYTLAHYHESEKKEPIIISEYVGETIDDQERQHFDLFPGTEDFESARFYEIADDGYDIEILAGGQKFIAFNRNPEAIALMRDYLERYEVIKDSVRAFENKWRIVDYDVLGQAITKGEVRASAKLYWRGPFLISGMVLGCAGPILIFGMPDLHLSVPSDYEYGFDAKDCLYCGAPLLMPVLAAYIGRELDERDALKAIKEARKPRLVE